MPQNEADMSAQHDHDHERREGVGSIQAPSPAKLDDVLYPPTPSPLTRKRPHRVRSNQPLVLATATDWSMTHSPILRYLLTHFVVSLLSPAILSVLKLGLAVPDRG